MTNQKDKLIDRGREELRGLFTLGLMAVLITLRVTQTKILLNLFGYSYDITGIIDLTLIFWGIYAFLMITWLSSDWLPERLCVVSYSVGTSMLFISFLLFYIAGIAIFSTFPKPLDSVAYLLLLPFLYLSIKAIAEVMKTFVGIMKTLIGFVKKHLS